MDAFFQSSCWQMYVNVCIRLKLGSGEFLDKLNRLVEKLRNENKFLECAGVYEKYLNDSENAIMCLLDGGHWEEAISTIHKYDRFDFFETNLIPALKAGKEDLLMNIEKYQERFIEKRDRLKEVRIAKAKRKEMEENEYEDELRNLNDDQSVSDMSNSTFDGQSSVCSTRSTASTINSRFSSTSSKRRNKKKSPISLKKNSPYEDLGLIMDLHDTITYSQNLKDSVAGLSKTLLLFNMNELCIEVQNRYETLMDLLENSTTVIWDYDLMNPEEKANLSFGTIKTSSTEFTKLDAKYRFPPAAVSKRQWKLHFYE